MARPRSPIKARLDEWYLKRVPFPATPFVDPLNTDPLRNGSVFARDLRESEIARIRHDILKEGWAGMVKPWNWMWARKRVGGSLGMGKTALLAYIADQINQDYGKKFFGHSAHWLAIYVPGQPIPKSVQELASLALVSAITPARGPSVERLILGRLRHMVIMLGNQTEYSPQVRNAADSRYLDDKWLNEHGVDLEKLKGTVEKHLRERKITAGFAHALASGDLEQHLATVNGDPNLLPPKPAFANKAMSLLLNDFARAAHAAEIKQITFLVDDFYYLVRRTQPSARVELAADLRSMAITGSAGYFAVKENLYSWVAVMHTQTSHGFNAAWEAVDLHRVAPLQLDSESSVVLGRIPIDQGSALLEAFLNYQRPAKPPSNTYPFSQEGLAAIAHIALEEARSGDNAIEPRGLLQAAYEVMCAALVRDDVPVPIGPDFVSHLLKGTPLPASLEEDEAAEPDREQLLGTAVGCPCPCHSDSEEDVVADVIARSEGATGKLLGYYCSACSLPVQIAPLVGV